MSLHLSANDPRPLMSLLVLLLGTMLAVYALSEPRWAVAGAFLTGAGITAWLLTNSRYEVAVLFRPFEEQGLAAADLLALPPTVVVSLLLWRSMRDQRPG